MPQSMPWTGACAGRTSGGVVLFFGGLEKKLLIADPLAVLIAPYRQDASPALLQPGPRLGYVMQLYSDFSG
jgi:D-alanyl-lipoteichoic acid acyltransferase DltB (MBOAT superfamily)